MKDHEQGKLVSFCALSPASWVFAVGGGGVAGQRDMARNKNKRPVGTWLENCRRDGAVLVENL